MEPQETTTLALFVVMTLISTYLISLAYKNVKFLLKHKWVKSLWLEENCTCLTNGFTCPGLSGSRICPILPLKNCCDDIESLTLLNPLCGQQNTLVSGVISSAAKCYWISIFCYWNYTFHSGIFMKFWPKYWNLSLISQLFPHKKTKTCVKVYKILKLLQFVTEMSFQMLAALRQVIRSHDILG